ncbi:MAG TPA: response regulator [Gemmatimonadaceae bacterium]|nr:response regulator [Gemmatimonadaceae bacterium]
MQASGERTVTERKRVVLVGDHDGDSRTILSEAFERAGYEVDVAADGDGLLREAATKPVDLVIAELYLPCATGRCAVRCLKQDEKLRHIPVIVFTTRVLDDDERWARESGVERFIRKPASLRALVAVARELIAAQPARAD